MPTNRGDVGKSFATQNASLFLGQFTRNKQPTPVSIVVPGATPGNRMICTTNRGTYVDASDVSAAGIGRFHELDDGGYEVTEVGTGNKWTVSVTGSAVVVTRIASSGSPILIIAG